MKTYNTMDIKAV